MDRFFAFFREELGGRASDPLEVYDLLRQKPEQAETGEILEMARG
jgi:hypothetical protein